jgi:hypothetical protein
MAKHIHIYLPARTRDATWEEGKHPRKEDGKFGTGGSAPASKTPAPKGGATFPGSGRGNEIAHHREQAEKAKALGRADLAAHHTQQAEALKRQRSDEEPDSSGFASMSVGQRATVSAQASKKNPAGFSSSEGADAMLCKRALSAALGPAADVKAHTGGAGNPGILLTKREGGKRVEITAADFKKAMRQE